MAFASVASSLIATEAGCSQRRISTASPDGPIAKLMSSADVAGVQRSLFRSRSLLRLISPLATPPLTGRWVSANGEIAPSARSSLTYCAPPIAFQ